MERNQYALTVNYKAPSSLVGFSIYCGAWIDGNSYGTFDDAKERIMTSNVGTAGDITQTGALFTPISPRTNSMRIILQTCENTTNPFATIGFDNGEAKDFKIVVASKVGLNDNPTGAFTEIYPNPSYLNGFFLRQIPMKITQMCLN